MDLESLALRIALESLFNAKSEPFGNGPDSSLEEKTPLDTRALVIDMTMYLAMLVFATPPSVTGYLMGCYCPLWVRLIPVAPVLYLGCLFCLYSGHGFELYQLLLWAYIAGDIYGLFRKARECGIPFWQLYHVDWMIFVSAATVFSLMYSRPTA